MCIRFSQVELLGQEVWAFVTEMDRYCITESPSLLIMAVYILANTAQECLFPLVLTSSSFKLFNVFYQSFLNPGSWKTC